MEVKSNGWKKRVFSLNYLNGKNHYYNFTKITLILFNQKVEKMRLLVLENRLKTCPFQGLLLIGVYLCQIIVNILCMAGCFNNYISATGLFNNQNNFWPADVHIIGKDILRFHAVYWPAFLMAANLPLPKTIFGHGWILSGEEKMSKSKGNILDPIELIDKFGADELRYYLMKDVIFGLDGSINIENFKLTINDLANNIGNLSNRIFTILDNNYNCKIPNISEGILLMKIY